jgi:hypothetical protein
MTGIEKQAVTGNVIEARGLSLSAGGNNQGRAGAY